MADRFGTEHHELVVRPDAVELLPRMLRSSTSPSPTPRRCPTYLVSELAAEHVKVVLSGDGGDELFGGYFCYVGDVWAPRVGAPVTAMRSLIERLPSGSGSARLEDRLKRFARGAHLDQPRAPRLLEPGLLAGGARAPAGRARRGVDPLAQHRERWAASAGAEELSRAQDLDLGIYMVDDILVKTDRTSMARSLEARVPFLDPRSTEFALALPRPQKVRRAREEVAARRAVAPLLPARSSGPSAASPCRSPAGSGASCRRSPARCSRRSGCRPGHARPGGGQPPLDVHVSGSDDLSRNLWGLVTLSLWLDRRPFGRRGRCPGPRPESMCAS